MLSQLSASSSSATSSAGSAGARCSALLPALREHHAPTFVVVNGENAAGGLGITPKIADEMFGAGVDVITLGNHAYRQREIYALPRRREPRSCARRTTCARSPGAGTRVVEPGGLRLGVVNLAGKVFLNAGRARRSTRSTGSSSDLRGAADHILVDMHAEVTSEKVAMGWYLDGRVTRRRRHAHARPDRRRARAAGRHRLHHRRRDDRRRAAA